MAIFNCYVSSPEGSSCHLSHLAFKNPPTRRFRPLLARTRQKRRACPSLMLCLSFFSQRCPGKRKLHETMVLHNQTIIGGSLDFKVISFTVSCLDSNTGNTAIHLRGVLRGCTYTFVQVSKQATAPFYCTLC